MKKIKLTTLIEFQAFSLPRKFLNNWHKYTYIQMSKSQDRPCNQNRDILCAKFVHIHKVMVNAKFQSSKPFGFKHKDF